MSVVLFTRDLRVHDNPALAGAATAGEVVPLFVHDPQVPSSPVRDAFLRGCLADLAGSLRSRGADLLVRNGDPVAETVRLARQVGAERVVLAEDVSWYARHRARRLTTACAEERIEVEQHPGVTVVPPSTLTPTGAGDHYRIFTPYWRAWEALPWRPVLGPPRRIRMPAGVEVSGSGSEVSGSGSEASGAGNEASGAGNGSTAPLPGGESAARRRLARWRTRAAGYAAGHDDLAGDRTSRLSPYLHFGCLSARELVSSMESEPEFVRQVCWRDFYTQVLAAFPALGSRDYRFGGQQWRDDPAALDAWRHGCTGLPIVDAGMRQMREEGWMHNRARLITAAFLCKWLRIDWRAGAEVFTAHLLDADVANNNGNWQWVAGTGTDTRRNRGFNPVRQALRFDPGGEYVRRYVPELAALPGPQAHRPWRADRRVPGYPEQPVSGPDEAAWL